mgnify:CR=1 FL=1
MLTIEELRKRKGWNISRLGQSTGLDRRLLADLERGAALATPEVAELLAKHGVRGLACSSELVQKKSLRGLRLEPYAFPYYNQEAWDRASSYKPDLYRSIKPQELDWLRRHVRADSALECDLWVKLLLAGAKLRLLSPLTCGFRDLPVVDDRGAGLAERVLPCLHLKTKEVDVYIWPQVSFRPDKWTFRVDALVLRVSPSPRWCTWEVDGGGHNHAKDNFRSAQLLKDTIRLTKAEIESPRLVEELIRRVLEL